MSTKFEQLLDLLVNEEMDKANELFHEIVVEKSRDIYENLIAEEEQEESVDEAEDEDAEESVDEAADDEAEESVDENVDLEDSYSMEADDEDGADNFGTQDKTDGFGDEVGATDGANDGGEEGSEESAIFDIKNAIAELEAAFADLEQAKGGMGPSGMDMDDADMGDKPAFGSDDKPEEEMMGMREGRRMTREYTEKVGNDWEKNSMKAQGQLAGAGTGERLSAPVDGRSPVSSGKGKPTTGAGAGGINQSATGEGAMDGTSPNGKVGGFVKNAQDMKTGNGNVPGGKMGVKNLSKVTQNSKTAGPVGSGTGDKAGQTSVGQAKSPLNGAPNRNA
jgi:hypothetical protein